MHVEAKQHKNYQRFPTLYDEWVSYLFALEMLFATSTVNFCKCERAIKLTPSKFVIVQVENLSYFFLSQKGSKLHDMRIAPTHTFWTNNCSILLIWKSTKIRIALRVVWYEWSDWPRRPLGPTIISTLQHKSDSLTATEYFLFVTWRMSRSPNQEFNYFHTVTYKQYVWLLHAVF